MSQPLLILVSARNEASVIGPTVSNLKGQLLANDQLVVIDDGSTDATAANAAQGGARVMQRSSAHCHSSKGAALQWGLAQLQPTNDLVVLVLDADTQPAAGFLLSIRTRFSGGAQAVQGLILPIAKGESSVTAVAAGSTLMEQVIEDRLRSRLSWPVRLRGTGMAMRGGLLTELVSKLKTHVEDVELSLLLAERGITVRFAPEAIVYDPLPETAKAASHQRARWLAGQLDVLRHHWPLLLRTLLRGPGAWSLLGSLMLKPRSLFVILRLTLLGAMLAWPAFRVVSVLLGLSLAVDALYYCIALALVGRYLRWRPTAAGVLSYGVMWLQSLWLMLFTPYRWLRSRP